MRTIRPMFPLKAPQLRTVASSLLDLGVSGFPEFVFEELEVGFGDLFEVVDQRRVDLAPLILMALGLYRFEQLARGAPSDEEEDVEE